MVEQTYIKRDLIDYVDEVSVEDAYSDRVHWVKECLPNRAAIQYWREGGYQGKLAFVIRLDGYLWLYNDYYGSCSGCDAFLSNEKNYIEDLLRGAYCFESEEDAIAYAESTDDYSWNGVIEPVKRMVRDPEKNLKNPKSLIEVKKGENSSEINVEIEQEK